MIWVESFQSSPLTSVDNEYPGQPAHLIWIFVAYDRDNLVSFTYLDRQASMHVQSWASYARKRFKIPLGLLGLI